MSLFSNEANSSSYVAGAILYKIPGIEVLGDGGPFSHLVLGHSLLHGLVAITSILGLCFDRIGGRIAFYMASSWFCLLRRSRYHQFRCCLIHRLEQWVYFCFGTSWGLRGLGYRFFLCCASFSQRGGSWDSLTPLIAAGAAIKQHILWQWRTIVISFLVGLGFRISALKWISKSFSDPLSVLVLATILAYFHSRWCSI